MASFDGLERMEALLEALGDPENELSAIHVAGTNGKGSTSVMIASVLEEAGYSVGLYTSPHLEDECERIQIWNGSHQMIDPACLTELKERVRAAWPDVKETLHNKGIEAGRLTVFEVYTAAAYLFFKEIHPDFVVLETGLGGRLDSTNTLKRPLVSVITQIGLDHTEQLGNTIFKVAREKAGIIKPGVPVVSQTSDLMVKNVLRRTAAEKGSAFTDASEKYSERLASLGPDALHISMQGSHQLRNALTAAEAIRAAGITVSDEAMREGLSHARLPGRFELLNEDAAGDGEPLLIIDGAHNPDAIEALSQTYTGFTRANKIKRTLVVFGCMKDKNSARMIQLLTEGLRGCAYAVTAVDNDRAEDPEHLGEMFVSHGRSCTVFESADEAYQAAMKSNYECVLVAGSIYLAGAFRSLYSQDHRSL